MSNPLTVKFFEKIAEGNLKEAQNAATEFTRITLRDEGILRRALAPTPLSYSELDDQLDTDMPVKLVEKEVRQPLSASVPFGTLPANWYMRGDKYRVDFARLVTRNYVIDTAQAQTYNRDIREMFKENAILDMETAEDVPFVNMLDAIVDPVDIEAMKALSVDDAFDAWHGLESANDMRSKLTGKVQYYDFSHANLNPLGNASGFNRVNLVESLKIMTKGFRIGEGDDNTPIHNKPAVVIMNVNTGLEFAKFDHDMFGGPEAQEMLKNGVNRLEWLGIKYIFTLKDEIVKDGEAYYLAKEGHLGKFYELDKPTLFVDRRAFMIEYFAYSCIGCSIGNPFGVAKVKYF